MEEKITLRPGRREDATPIAGLILEAMTEECCKHFYGPFNTIVEFHAVMSRLVERDDTQYSYLNTICAVDSKDNIVGISVSYDGARLLELRKRFVEYVKTAFYKDFSNMPEETQAGELYLDSLAVKPEWRGHGIGKRLLLATIDKAKTLNCGPVGLLMEPDNAKAEALYTSVGFRPVGEKEWGGHRMKHLVCS